MNCEKKLLSEIINSGERADLTSLSGLNLAYIGDAVFEILVRTMIITEGKINVNLSHMRAKNFVRAQAQSHMYYRLEGILSAEELAVMKRGRNAKSYTKAKNATVSDYRHATGIEALFGYLYLKGDTDRLMELFGICIDTISAQGGNDRDYGI